MKNFDEWNRQKKNIDKKHINRSFEEKEVWFINMGLNINTEQNGSGEFFLRPVLIFKKFGDQSFLGIPMTTTERTGSYFYNFTFKNKKNTLLLTQARYFDINRFFNSERYGKVSDKEFNKIKEKFKKLFF